MTEKELLQQALGWVQAQKNMPGAAQVMNAIHAKLAQDDAPKAEPAWTTLTEDELAVIFKSVGKVPDTASLASHYKVSRAVETALKMKNSPNSL